MGSKANSADVPLGTINLTLNASSPEQLANMIASLAKTFGGYDKLAEKISNAAASTNPVTGTSTAALDVAVPSTPAPAPEASEKVQSEPATVPSQNVVKDTKDTAKVRDEAIQKLTEYFGKNPSAIADLASLQKKYGVRLFKDIADDRVPEFAQDAHMLVNGSVQA